MIRHLLIYGLALGSLVSLMVWSEYRLLVVRLQSEGKTIAQIAEAKQSMQSMFAYYDTWPGLIGITFMEIFPIGLLVALVSALVLKKTTSRSARV